MINIAMQDAINEQINHELFSSYLYLSMSAHFESAGLPGFAQWLRLQSDEERAHAMKFYEHLLDRGGQVKLAPIAAPRTEWATTLEAVEEVLAHEKAITALIHALYEKALTEKDYPAQILLQWFINEQVEEEKSATEILDQMKRIEAHETAVLMLDHQLSKRRPE